MNFVYVATGEKYLREAAQSALSCRRCVPGCRTILVTPDASPPDGFDEVVAFGSGIRDPFELKIAGIEAVSFPRFVFLDTDTYLLGDISDIDDLLDRFDLAAAQAPSSPPIQHLAESAVFLENAPACFPEFNTGVIAFRRSADVGRMLAAWLALHKQHARQQPPPRTQDQASFREVVFTSGLRVARPPRI